MLDKIKGGLFGVAIGDAMGATTEFMKESEIKSKYGRITDILGGGWLNLTPGEVTDDTAMTLAVANGIIISYQDPISEIGNEFLKWFAGNPSDVGITIRTVLEIYKGDWEIAAEYAHNHLLDKRSAGNGSLMRCLPAALAYPDVNKMEEITKQQSKMTHFDDQAVEACVIYNRIAVRLLNHEPLKRAIEKEITNTRYQSILTHEPDCPPDGYCVHTLKWVFHWLLNSETFLDVVGNAAGKGGDSDTIGAIAGGLKGIEVGFEALPVGLVEKLLCREELNQTAAELFKVRK